MWRMLHVCKVLPHEHRIHGQGKRIHEITDDISEKQQGSECHYKRMNRNWRRPHDEATQEWGNPRI